MIKLMAKVFIYIKTEHLIQVNGSKISKKVMVYKDGLMDLIMKEVLKMD
jgi:hypothetical protein